MATYPIAADAEAERTHTSPSFSVTWIHDPSSRDAPSLRDDDGDGAPDSVEKLLAALEASRSFLLGRLGYRAPPVSGPLRVYVADREGPAIVKLAPGGHGLSKPSFIVIPTSIMRPLIPQRHLRAVAVHEYFHTVQNGYDSDYDHWIGEATASWMEDVFDDTSDANHDLLEEFVPSPRRSLTDSGGNHEHGAFLFIQFLVERYARGNAGLVRELWEHMAAPEAGGPGLDSLAAIDAVLASRGVSFPEAWAEFLLWRWDLDRFEEGSAYQEVLGSQWPKPLQDTEVADETCRLTSDLNDGLPPLSGEYSLFRPAERPANAKATLTVEGPAGATGFALVQKRNGKQKVQLLQLADGGLASARVRFGGDRVRRVILGVGNPARTGPAASFGYSLRIDGRSAVTAEAVNPPPETQFFGGLPLSGRVFCHGRPEGQAAVVLVQRKRSGEEVSFPLATSTTGVWARTIDPGETSTYRFDVADPLLSEATSPPWEVAVRVAMDLEAPDPAVALGEPVRVEGQMAPPHPGGLIQIEYRRPDLSWRAGPQVTPGQDGSFSADLVLPGTGIWHLRASVLSTGDDDHLGNTTGHDVFVSVS